MSAERLCDSIQTFALVALNQHKILSPNGVRFGVQPESGGTAARLAGYKSMLENVQADSSGTDPATDFATLIAAARGGDSVAISRVVNEARPYLLLMANQDLDSDIRARLGASDVVQQTMLAAYEKLDQFRGGTQEEFNSWIRQILKNDLLNAGRHFRGAQRVEILAGTTRSNIWISQERYQAVIDTLQPFINRLDPPAADYPLSERLNRARLLNALAGAQVACDRLETGRGNVATWLQRWRSSAANRLTTVLQKFSNWPVVCTTHWDGRSSKRAYLPNPDSTMSGRLHWENTFWRRHHRQCDVASETEEWCRRDRRLPCRKAGN